MSDENSFTKQFAHGVELFNAKEFFDCHDAWEELWQEDRTELRLFLQGMIQSAVGSYHLTNGNTTGAISQYTKALDKLEKYPDDYCNVDLATFRIEIARCRDGALAMHAQGATYEVAPHFFPEVKMVE